MDHLRVGLGWDLHRLEADERPGAGLRLAGVAIPCPWRAIAHSDGDVVLHAVCDALLGAVAAGDIGEHFPDTEAEHAGRDSRWFVSRTLELPALAGWQPLNVDVNIVAQVPRLAPHKPAMRTALAAVLGLDAGRVSIKARTKEGVDAVGEKRAIEAQVVVLVGAW